MLEQAHHDKKVWQNQVTWLHTFADPGYGQQNKNQLDDWEVNEVCIKGCFQSTKCIFEICPRPSGTSSDTLVFMQKKRMVTISADGWVLFVANHASARTTIAD